MTWFRVQVHHGQYAPVGRERDALQELLIRFYAISACWQHHIEPTKDEGPPECYCLLARACRHPRLLIGGLTVRVRGWRRRTTPLFRLLRLGCRCNFSRLLVRLCGRLSGCRSGLGLAVRFVHAGSALGGGKVLIGHMKFLFYGDNDLSLCTTWQLSVRFTMIRLILFLFFGRNQNIVQYRTYFFFSFFRNRALFIWSTTQESARTCALRQDCKHELKRGPADSGASRPEPLLTRISSSRWQCCRGALRHRYRDAPPYGTGSWAADVQFWLFPDILKAASARPPWPRNRT